MGDLCLSLGKMFNFGRAVSGLFLNVLFDKKIMQVLEMISVICTVCSFVMAYYIKNGNNMIQSSEVRKVE
jgi:hypothetical protein